MISTKRFRAVRFGNYTIAAFGRWSFTLVLVQTLMAVVVVLLLCPWLWQGWIDGYVSYSGTVVEKGIEHHLLAVRGSERYLLIRSDTGTISKRYVDHYGYAFSEVGTYVVKKKGFSEYPRRPGDRTPGQLLRDLQDLKQRRSQ